MMAWLWQQALGTVFLESGINSVIHIFCSPLVSGEINATAYSCEKKSTFYLQVKIFLLRLSYTKAALGKLQKKKKRGKTRR